MYRDIAVSNSPWLRFSSHGVEFTLGRDKIFRRANGPIVSSGTVHIQIMLLVAWRLLSIIGRWNQVVAAYVYLHKSWQTKRGTCNDSFSPWSWNDVKWWLFLHSTMAFRDHEKYNLVWSDFLKQESSFCESITPLKLCLYEQVHPPCTHYHFLDLIA